MPMKKTHQFVVLISGNDHVFSCWSSKHGSSTVTVTHIKDFFAQYPDFDYDSSSPIMQEFYRMCDVFDWGKEDQERLAARSRLKDAMTLQFNQIYGEDENDLESWQNLCYACHVDHVPDNLKECRNLVRSLHVNLVDLVDNHGTQSPVHLFESEAALSQYTKKTGNFFPKENAYAGGLLRFLLRRIMNPMPALRSVGRGKGRRRRH